MSEQIPFSVLDQLVKQQELIMDLTADIARLEKELAMLQKTKIGGTNE